MTWIKHAALGAGAVLAVLATLVVWVLVGGMG